MPLNERSPELNFDEEDVVLILRDPSTRPQAAEALAQIRVGREAEIPNADGLDMAADMVVEDRAHFWVDVLKRKGCLATFVVALRTRGLAQNIDGLQTVLDDRSTMFDPLKLRDFLLRVETYRCKVRVGQMFKGSGILVGPSSVLTAWHVIAQAKPDPDGEPMELPEIDVEFADGRIIPVAMLSASSPCGTVEWPPDEGRAPRTDAEVEHRHDVALLRLKQPVGIHLAFAALASPSYEFRVPAEVVLISHPEGEWRGVEFARLKKLRNVTARWGYDVKGNRGGSSGGGCFDTKFSLAGIHQGRAEGGGRLIPLIRFDSTVRQAITNDEIPTALWSIDGTPESGLVIGRDTFFLGYQTAMRGASRARGIWIRRVDLQNDLSGLPFSFEILDRLVARSPDTRLIRVSFDAIVHDLPNEIARRASDAGIQVEAPDARSGVGVDQTEPEAVIADRTRRLAQMLDEKAHKLGIRLWVFFDHPSVIFGDESRWALTAFVDQALRLDYLRIALAGFEAIQMPGARFNAGYEAVGVGAPGLMIEFITDVKTEDVKNLIRSAANDMKRTISPERVEEWTAEALKDLASVNGRYDSVLRTEIASRLQPRLKQLYDEGAKA